MNPFRLVTKGLRHLTAAGENRSSTYGCKVSPLQSDPWWTDPHLKPGRIAATGLRTTVFCGAFLLFSWLNFGIALALPYVERHGMSGAEFQTEFNLWTAAPYRFRLTRICGSETSGQARYTALFEKSDKVTPWMATAMMDGPTFKTTHNANHAAGYRLVWHDVFTVNSSRFYNAIWEKTGGGLQRISLGESLPSHSISVINNIKDKYYLTDMSTCAANDDVFHSGVWTFGAMAPTDQLIYPNDTSAEYQARFNSMGAQGYGLVRVNGFTMANVELFSSVWRKPSGSQSWSFHGMTESQFEAENLNAQYQGYRPVSIDPYNHQAQTKFNATWARNGGFTGSQLNEISAFVTAYMKTGVNANAGITVPGLSLALSHQGRLVYARGFGLGDIAADERAHPLHRWRIASVSKSVCAVSVLRALEESPVWDLDTRLFGTGALFANDYGTLPYTNELAITARQLLNHSGGWTNTGIEWYYNDPNRNSPNPHKRIVDHAVDITRETYLPGSRYFYSNLGYIVAARIPEKISGQTFANYTKAKIFDPCGITSMQTGGRTLAERKINEVVYYPDSFGVDNDTSFPDNIDPDRMDGSTAWIAKPSDLLLLARRIDGDSLHRDILQNTSISQMRIPNGMLDFSSPPRVSNYGLGVYPIPINGSTYWAHNGTMNGTAANLAFTVGNSAFAYARNKCGTNDGASSAFSGTVFNFIKKITDSISWPSINLFGSYNPEYDAWAKAAFGTTVTTQIGAIEAWDPAGDPDEDGRVNALEAYLGSDPTDANTRGSWFTVYHQGGLVILRWTIKDGYRGVEIQLPQWSSDLKTWQNTPYPIVKPPNIPTGPGYSTYETMVPTQSTVKFLRLNLKTP